MAMQTVKFGDVMLQVGNGADPEAFTALCGINTYERGFNINTQSEDVPDCPPPAPGTAEEVGFDSPTKTSVGEFITFTGVVDPDFIQDFDALVYKPDPTNIRFLIVKGGVSGYYEGPAILTAAQGGSWDRVSKASGTFSGTLTWTERPTWVPVP